MRFTPTILLASCAALSAAAPTFTVGEDGAISYGTPGSSTKMKRSDSGDIDNAPTTITVGEDDVILYGRGGRFTKMKRSDFEDIDAARNSGVVPPKPSYLDDSLYTVTGNETGPSTGALAKRAGDTIIVPNPHQRFYGWDVLMTTIAKGPQSIGIQQGISIGNSISVGSSATFSLVKDFLDWSVSVDYSHTWTTTQTQSFNSEIPEGKYGAFVSNAWTNRESGNVWQGEIGGEGSLVYYQADSFEDKSFGDLSWVDGVIAVCLGDTPDLPRCLGEGSLGGNA